MNRPPQQQEKFLPWPHQHGLVVTEAEADAIAKRWEAGAPAGEEPQEAVTTGASKGGKGASGKGKDSLDDVSTTDAASEGSQRPAALATVPRSSGPPGPWSSWRSSGQGILGEIGDAHHVHRVTETRSYDIGPSPWEKGRGKGKSPPADVDHQWYAADQDWRGGNGSGRWSGQYWS